MISLQIVIISLIISCVFAGNDLDKEVMKAYDLRMEGKLDEASKLLDSILSVDETNAMANFEMARLKSYLFTGGGEVDIDDIISFARKATESDPTNASYAYYYANACFLHAYSLMQKGGEEFNEAIRKACSKYEEVLTIDPDFGVAMLSLVEIYGYLPEDMEGDLNKAKEYADKLSGIDDYLAAKAKVVLAPENLDVVRYWKDLLVLNGEDPDYLKEAGIACLYVEDVENAEKYFRQVMALDPYQNTLLLDLSRYHLYKVMRNRDLLEEELPVARSFVEEYLDTDPVVPMKAYSLGLISKFERFLGNRGASEKYMQLAVSLDPYFSRASGLPAQALFTPPDKVYYQFSSFFSPF